MVFRHRFQPISHRFVQLGEGLLAQRRAVVRDAALEHQYQQLVTTERLENFYRVARGERNTFSGLYFNDSDVYKWLEACAYILGDEPNDSIRQRFDEVKSAVLAAQQTDGYLNTFFTLNHPEARWVNLADMHEMYCAGHFIEAAVAAHDALGDQQLLAAAVRIADHIRSIFGPDRRRGTCGHQEIEVALVRLARATDDPSYSEFARWLVDIRGGEPKIFQTNLQNPDARAISPQRRLRPYSADEYDSTYWQEHAPIREHTEVVGHAVRAMYFYAGATDIALPEDQALVDALERCWSNLTERRMYITGGIGPSARNEGFTRDYDLPNLTAYAETCAAIALCMWGRRLGERTGDSRFFDVVERAIFNGVLSGISADGRGYFYANPLESRGSHQRTPWFSCACCPPNIARFLASISDYAFSFGIEAEDGLAIHIPISATVQIPEGPQLAIDSNYPAQGEFTIRWEANWQGALRIRIPDWCRNATAETTGFEEKAEYADGYMVWNRRWLSDQAIKISFEMPTTWQVSHAQVLENAGRIALSRGPVIYCAESHPEDSPPQHFIANPETEVTLSDSDSVLPSLTVSGLDQIPSDSADIYATDKMSYKASVRRFIPYYQWANHGPSAMQIWVRTNPQT